MDNFKEKIKESLVKRPEFLSLLREFESIKSSIQEMRGLLSSDSSGFRTNLQAHAERLTEMENRTSKLFADGKLEAEDAGKKLKEELTGLIDGFRKEIYFRVSESRGGAIGTKFTNEGTMISTRYKDINFIPINGLSISESDDSQNRRVDLTLSATNGTLMSGSGMINQVPIFTATQTVGNSNFSQDGSGNFLVNGLATSTITGDGNDSTIGGALLVDSGGDNILLGNGGITIQNNGSYLLVGGNATSTITGDGTASTIGGQLNIGNNGGISLGQGTIIWGSVPFATDWSSMVGTATNTISLFAGSTAGQADLNLGVMTGQQTFTFPDQSGTLAIATNANGTFTTVDSKTVTVVNGIITSIV